MEELGYLSRHSVVRISVTARDLSLFRNFYICSAPHPSSYPIGAGFLSRGQSGRGVNLASYLYVAEVINQWSYTSAPTPSVPSWRGNSQVYRCTFPGEWILMKFSVAGSVTKICRHIPAWVRMRWEE
jgi:hypothetical protein